MTYQDAIAFIHNTTYRGGKDDLNNMKALLAYLDHPEKDVPMLHVAGTNGKGSVCACLQAMLRCAGYRVGLYTSPYLQRYNERMRVDGEPIPDALLAMHMDRIAAVVWKLRAQGIWPTEFEIGTALAFVYFASAKVDIAVIEVGLGGRLDPTNVIHPLVSVITAIGMDHMRYLGNTEELIAAEKAGIAKAGVPLVLYPAKRSVADVVEHACKNVGASYVPISMENIQVLEETERGCTFAFHQGAWEYPRVHVSLPGTHQMYNAATALCALCVLRTRGFRLPDDALLDGIARVQWPGRLEWLWRKPAVLMDGAHNPQGVQSLADFLLARLPQKRKIALVGVLRDKEYRGIAKQIARFAQAAVTVTPDSHRALEGGELAALLQEDGIPAEAASSFSAAWERAVALAGQDGVIIIAGSLYLVGEARTWLQAPACTLLMETKAEE